MEFRGFSDEQRSQYKAILKVNEELADQYLNLIQPHIAGYVMDTTINAESPLEPAERTRAVLEQIANHSRQLFDLVANLDDDGAGLWLDRARMRIGTPYLDILELRDNLMLLSALSSGASTWKSDRKPGRPVDFPSRRFLAACIKHYVTVFGEEPKYSKGTKFQNFLKAVSGDVCRPGMSLQGDLTSSIAAAISTPPRTT